MWWGRVIFVVLGVVMGGGIMLGVWSGDGIGLGFC